MKKTVLLQKLFDMRTALMMLGLCMAGMLSGFADTVVIKISGIFQRAD